ADRVEDTLIAALKAALAEPGEQRLYRSGKLPGLFATRSGANAEAAGRALRDGLLEVVRTETKGKLSVEWVRLTPAGGGLPPRPRVAAGRPRGAARRPANDAGRRAGLAGGDAARGGGAVRPAGRGDGPPAAPAGRPLPAGRRGTPAGGGRRAGAGQR